MQKCRGLQLFVSNPCKQYQHVSDLFASEETHLKFEGVQ